MEPIIRVSNLTCVYNDKTQVTFSGQDLIINPGEKVALLGTNGSGKTTLLAALMGLLKPEKGIVEVAGLSPTRDFPTLRKKARSGLAKYRRANYRAKGL